MDASGGIRLLTFAVVAITKLIADNDDKTEAGGITTVRRLAKGAVWRHVINIAVAIWVWPVQLN